MKDVKEETIKSFPDHINAHPKAIVAAEKELGIAEISEKKLRRRALRKENPLRLNQRLDSHSKRIKNIRNKLDQILSNQKHYLKLRLPNVLKREKAKVLYSRALDQARKLLTSLNKKHFTFLSNSKDIEKRTQRYIGMFTHVEMQRLRRLLDIDHSTDYLLYRKDSYKNLKDKHILLVNNDEKRKLLRLLKK